MSKRPRRNHSPAFKAKVALAAVHGEKMLAELAQQYDMHRNQIAQWRLALLDGGTGVCGVAAKTEAVGRRRKDAKREDRRVYLRKQCFVRSARQGRYVGQPKKKKKSATAGGALSGTGMLHNASYRPGSPRSRCAGRSCAIDVTERSASEFASFRRCCRRCGSRRTSRIS